MKQRIKKVAIFSLVFGILYFCLLCCVIYLSRTGGLLSAEANISEMIDIAIQSAGLTSLAIMIMIFWSNVEIQGDKRIIPKPKEVAKANFWCFLVCELIFIVKCYKSGFIIYPLKEIGPMLFINAVYTSTVWIGESILQNMKQGDK